jgi:hypothetical protein
MTTIYVQLLDEAVDVLRPVPAEPLGGAMFRIRSDAVVPDDEVWEFVPGDEVMCHEQVHDGDKILVAVSQRQAAR